MMPPVPHIGVCVCTFKRPRLLEELLMALGRQTTEGQFTHSVVVVDNDAGESAREVVNTVTARIARPIGYFVEPRQNIALARNMAVANGGGDFVAFIDDDECPDDRWLLTLFRACEAYSVAGVLAPVRPKFERTPPAWLVRTNSFERPEYATGTPLPWQATRTGNALVRRKAIDDLDVPFLSVYGAGGEDQDFFRRMIERGHRFVWCNEAPVLEFVPVARSTAGYLCRRSLLRGQNERHRLSLSSILKSAAAMMVYVLMMPFLLIFGRHLFFRYFLKFLDHTGKLCAAVGLKPMGEKYLTS